MTTKTGYRLLVGFPMAEAAGKTLPFDGRCEDCAEPMLEFYNELRWFCPYCKRWAVRA